MKTGLMLFAGESVLLLCFLAVIPALAAQWWQKRSSREEDLRRENEKRSRAVTPFRTGSRGMEMIDGADLD